MSKTSDKKLKELVDIYYEKGVKETAESFGVKESTVERNIREAKRRGILPTNTPKSRLISKIIENYTEAELKIIANGKKELLDKSKKLNINFEGKRVRVGVITDTHIGHKNFYESRLMAAFEEFKKEKVDFICHCGDVTEGMSHRPGHIYELTHLGYDQQKNYAIELFGQWTDTPIYAIDGNHDRWYIKSNGAMIVKDIAKALDNFNFLGHDEGDIMLNDNVSLRLWHGEDGNSYALSYRVQKILESLSGGEKPNVMFCGHTHKYVKLFERNVHAVSVGCIEAQTKWMRSKRIPAHTGFGIYDITVNELGVSKMSETWYPFY